MHSNKQLYIRRIHENSTMTSKESFKNLYGYLVCVEKLGNFIFNKKNDTKVEKSINIFLKELQKNIVRIFNKLSSSEKMNVIKMSENLQRILNDIIITNGSMNLLSLSELQSDVLISVIVPVYNVKCYLEECINSILGQSYYNIEIICVDDGSTDGSSEICDDIALKDSRLRVIHQKNAGLSAARNTGLLHATGEYVAFVDSDDWIHPNYLECLYHLCKDNICDIAQCGLQKIYPTDSLQTMERCEGVIFTGREMEHRLFEAQGWKNVVVWNKLYHRSLFSNLSFEVGKQHEDEFITYQIYWKAKNIACTDCVLYYYRQRDDSIMGREFNEKSLDAIIAHEKRMNFFKDKDSILYKKSLLALSATLTRSLKNIHKYYPERRALVLDVENKFMDVQNKLNDIGIPSKIPIPDWITFSEEKRTYKPIACTYLLDNKYSTDILNLHKISIFTCKVSVIIPAYNNAKYISKCLDSVLMQSLKNIEIIVINDGSTDETINILKRYEAIDSRVIVIDQPNLGVAIARNKGILKASGEYICFMDSDDFYPCDTTLELLYTKAVTHKANICGGSFSMYEEGTGNIKTEFEGDNEKYTLHTEGIVRYYDYQFDYGYHRFIYKKDFILNNNIIFPPYKRYQDPPFFVKAMILAKWFYAVPDIVYRYRVGFQEKSTSFSPEKLCDMLKGYLDNLILSRQNGLAELHALTVRRIEDSYSFIPIMYRIEKYDYEILDLLIQLNNAIDVRLLKQSGMNITEDYYILRELKNMIWRIDNSKQLADNIQHGYSFRIGRVITFFPRKIRGGIRCYKEHGLKYTIKRTLYHLRLYR